MRNSFAHLLLLLTCFESCFQQNNAQSKTNEDGIRTATMADVGIDSTVVNRIDTTIKNGTYPNIHSVLIARHNMLVYEKILGGQRSSLGI